MLGLGWQELMIILVIIIIIFGAGKLPEAGSALGRGVKEFKATARDESLPEAKTETTTRRKDETVVIEARDLRADEI